MSEAVPTGAIVAALEKAVPRLRQGSYTNEQAVREALVLPILTALGWDWTDPAQVRREHAVGDGARKVDYGLFVNARKPEILVEVKAVGCIGGGDQQLFQYAFHEGVPMTLLTDGQTWKFYLPAERGSYEDRCFYTLDLLERSTAEASHILTRYLEQARVATKQALNDAKHDHETREAAREAAEAIPLAWERLIHDNDEAVLDALVARAEQISGHRPAEEDVARFLRSLQPRGGASSPIATGQKRGRAVEPIPALLDRRLDVPPPAPTQAVAEVVATGSNGSKVSPRETVVVVRGKRIVEKTAIAALVRLLRSLAEQDATFLERLSTRLTGRTRTRVARSPEEIYPGYPQYFPRALPLVTGWYIDGNVSNQTKMRIVALAREVADVRPDEYDLRLPE